LAGESDEKDDDSGVAETLVDAADFALDLVGTSADAGDMVHAAGGCLHSLALLVLIGGTGMSLLP